MPKTTALGDVLPLPGEDLLDAWADFADTARRIIPVSDLGAAALMLDRAATAGLVISTTKPAFFSVGGAEPVQYVCTGKDSTSGGWRLVPFNEGELYNGTWVPDFTGQKDVTPGTSPGFDLLKFTLPARPYDRRVRATAAAWGYRKTGWASLRVFGLGKVSATDFSTTDGSGVVTMTSGIVPADQTAVITARAYGAGTVRVASASAETWLTVEADPIRMTI